jgi:hypothetical protein
MSSKPPPSPPDPVKCDEMLTPKEVAKVLGPRARAPYQAEQYLPRRECLTTDRRHLPHRCVSVFVRGPARDPPARRRGDRVELWRERCTR